MNKRAGSTAAIVLAAGASRRLGQPKQLLPLGDGTVLDATLAMVRRCEFDRRIVTVGAAADQIRASVDLSGFEVAEVSAIATPTATSERAGCSASIAAALQVLDGAVDAAVLFLGDQPGVDPDAVKALRERCETTSHLTSHRASHPEPLATIGVCRYHDGIGQPFWFDATMFESLSGLHGDKAMWKLIESGRWPVTEVVIDRAVPLDVDTWDDYERLLNSFRDSFRDRPHQTLESRPS